MEKTADDIIILTADDIIITEKFYREWCQKRKCGKNRSCKSCAKKYIEANK